ncbi:ParA family protein [Solimonas sp. SE-A11]|uniref:ParA family protein n=1 Tax=Solimonas sp. SE-A11 TaxID=3054954 RepID=UPI00259C6BD3|nr:ParA family protein [Solimonas sp. SE-A11]MDM4770851.1 ParA family protein [Solimonas sp. SE-A11]
MEERTGTLILTVTSTKGGVGKTTLAANLGGLLADLGQRVLLIDADIQPTLSSYYALERQASRGLTALMTEGDLESSISRTMVGCDLVVSDDPEGRLQNWVLHTPDGRVRLKHTLARLNRYDVIIIDTQGAVGPLQDAAVLAADVLLSPIPPEILSAREFARGTLGMLERLRPMQFLGAPVGALYGVIYRMDRAAEAIRIAAELRKESFAQSRGLIRILDTVVQNTVAYREAATNRTPVHRWESRRRGPSQSARDTMLALARELLPHISNEPAARDGGAE